MGTSAETAAAAEKPVLALVPRLRSQIANIIGIVLMVVVVGGAIINAIKDWHQFTIVFLNGVTNGSIYALVAIGYTLVYGILELINFAHGDVFTWGAMITYTVAVSVLGLNGTESGFPLFGSLVLALVCAAAFCATLNMGVERVAYRRLR